MSRDAKIQGLKEYGVYRKSEEKTASQIATTRDRDIENTKEKK
ncbi:hypothetical protein TOT_020000873 [Theileria orientalis strain Shintoku]|uniref:Uncharacterized protein n=1 Tax=Theileria orientalis strain Shintoku TaxID=869250 RepID=J4D877_THEOR|nr:hypothetical protein TOT_020000873 [Theileria orientalis strain Shintoku]BAM40620.1 hypothetical protein TOT_020000873 [Theileria orientalis strain Shintoku]|eukprot:XP_009690921.1 hypothetical protein TOT_020000873 [Theileria orientalis strain Shintoku]